MKRSVITIPMGILMLGTVLGRSACADWSAISLHPVGVASSRGRSISGGLQVGEARVNDGGLYSGHWYASTWEGTASSWVGRRPAGAEGAAAYGTAHGRFVGSTQFCIGFPTYVDHAAVWSPSDEGMGYAWTDLHPDWAYQSTARGVYGTNVVGSVYSNGRWRASLWTRGVSGWWVTDLHPTGADKSEAYGVSAGQQVGRVDVAPSVPHAALWSGTAGGWIDLHPAVASGGSEAYAVCENQQVGRVGIYGTDHAALWHGTAESWLDLHPAGVASSVAYAASGNTQVGKTFSGGAYHAALWSGSAITWVDLHLTLPSSVYSHSEASGVEACGSDIWVIGTAYNCLLGRDEAMLWHLAVPEPSSALPLVTALAGLAANFSRRRV